jgi:integrase
MPLNIVRRKDTSGALTIVGTVKLPDGSRQRVRARAQSDRLEIAREEAAALEAKILRDAWFGKRRGSRGFAEAVESYLKHEPRHPEQLRRLGRIVRALGDVPLSAVDQAAIDRVRDKVHRPNPSPATVRAGTITPIRAVLNHAYRRGWCDKPQFDIPRVAEGRTLYLLPEEAQRLVAAAAPHLKPLIVFALGTGARLGEALKLHWRDVDLQGARAIFWQTKNGRRRVAQLPPAVIAALGRLPDRDGAVFRWDTKPGSDGMVKRSQAYRTSGGGSPIKTGWNAALQRAGLDSALTPHTMRHSWASWFYAVNRDLLMLKVEGGWSTIAQVERYAHLMPKGHDAAICAFWGLAPPATGHARDTAS